MRIFISWSGTVALEAARLFQRWLPRVLPFVKEPWLSPQIEAGKVGAQALMEEMRRTDAGLVILTPDSQHSPWVIFEAGGFAFADKLVPLLVGLASQELSEPFPHFQYREVTRTGLPDAVLAVNALAGRLDQSMPLDRAEVVARVEAHWPELRSGLEPLVATARAMTREQQLGPCARYVTQAERKAAEQQHRAEHQESRADAFRSLVEFFLRYEGALDQIPPDSLVKELRRDIPVIRRIVQTEDFGEIEEGIPFRLDYRLDG